MKYVIIGAVAGGATAATRLRRLDEKAEIIMFEKGEYISYANCGMPYYIGNIIKERDQLFVQKADTFSQRFNIQVRINTRITAINSRNKTVTAIDLSTGRSYDESYDKLVLSPGAESLKLRSAGSGLKGIFNLRNVYDTDAIKTYAEQYPSGKAVVIGAGFVGLEIAENLHASGFSVTIIEKGNQVLPPADFPMAAILQEHIRSKGIDLRLDTEVIAFVKGEEGIHVILRSSESIETHIVILALGVTPDVKLASSAGLKLGKGGKGIEVNRYLQTSDPDIYAVGDAILFKNPISGKSVSTYLAGPANKQGRICANNIVFGNSQEYCGAIQTAILKLFDLNAAVTGLSSRQLRAAGIAHIVSTTHSSSHAGYYPGAMEMTVQLAFSPADGRLLGAQVVGGQGVDKRIDILSLVIKNQGTIDDLVEFEQAYAPPFSSAKDPVNIAGFVAENILLKRSEIFQCTDVKYISPGSVLIDVRTPDEFMGGSIPKAMNIPLDEIRGKIKKIPRDAPLYIFCQKGQRGYLAQQILLQNGYRTVFNLSGGYLLWKSYAAETKLGGS
ncbi:FAD-dependent oxidoreductase [Pedobacter sp. AW31-3R]|uniref:FAD-dependent oxidoreductase n=1 Tax=Pedobacter sp. AW31-3R TaxID=3445781 RepID=UPI003F9F4AEB